MSDNEKSKIAQQIEDAKKKHRLTLYQKRLEISRDAFQKLKAGSYPEATEGFKTYIRILEDYLDLPEGGLDPDLFDKKKDASELLLISGVYWDLTKLMDRTRSAAKIKEFEFYLGKFILFSRKMPHHKISADTLGKYLSTNQPHHKKQFEDAFKLIGSAKCFVISAHLDQVGFSALNRYRDFRDEVLRSTVFSRNLVALYYRKGPRLAQGSKQLPKMIQIAIGKTLWLGSFVASAIVWIKRALS